jgi:hypothetical protein
MQRFIILNEDVHIVTTLLPQVNELVLIDHEGPASLIQKSATGNNSVQVQFTSSQIVYLKNFA